MLPLSLVSKSSLLRGRPIGARASSKKRFLIDAAPRFTEIIYILSTQNRHLVTVIYNKFNGLNVIYDF